MITISQLFSQTTAIIRTHYRTLGLYVLLLITPTIVVILLQQVLVDIDPTTAKAVMSMKNALIGIITRIIISLSMLWASIGIIYATNTILVTGKGSELNQELSKATRMLLPTFLLSILISFLSFVSFLLLIIPGIIVSIWLTFSYHTYLLEHTTIFESIKRSKRLVRGRFFEVFLQLAIMAIISVAIIFSITIIPTILFPFLSLDGLIPYIGLIASSISALYIIVSLTILYKSMMVLPSPAAPTTEEG